jgi:outer membrane protein OmpA-like peptidoglycan-associated protein
MLSGCATKKYVREQVQGLEPSIKEARTLGEENRERIDAVDKRAQQGIAEARTASEQRDAALQKSTDAAAAAASKANDNANAANKAIAQTNNNVKALESRVATINDIYTQTETQTVLFDYNRAILTDQARSTLDRIASSVTGQPSGYMIELQGFTDSRGSDQYNLGLSQRRAESVQRYLVSKNVPLYRISIVGLGKDNPVADNKTRQGRDQNRRVEIRVLRSTSNRQTN